MAETMYREDADDIFSRLEFIRKKMGRPNTSAKEMKTLQLREDNLLEMLKDGMTEFKKGGKVQAMRKGGKVRAFKNGGAVMNGRGPKFKGQS